MVGDDHGLAIERFVELALEPIDCLPVQTDRLPGVSVAAFSLWMQM